MLLEEKGFTVITEKVPQEELVSHQCRKIRTLLVRSATMLN